MPRRLTFHLIPHTHWDREWYLPEAAFRPRLVAAVGAALNWLGEDPAGRFVLDGQTVLAEDVLDLRPEWIPRVAQAVARGALEVGPWYVLSDELIPSGESLIRNLLHGVRDADALGRRMNVLYSPDAFGHPAILPSIAREFGITGAVVWRGLGQPTGSDRDLYRWTGPDGCEMLTYHLPPQGYEIGADLAESPDRTPRRWEELRNALVARSATSQVAVFMGADHHAPSPVLAQIRQAVQNLEPDHDVRFSSLGEFFSVAAAEATPLPEIEGELRWSYGHTWTLQGTHATRARLKRRFANVELHQQRVVEPLVALASWGTDGNWQGVLRSTARTLLKCQFHDTICGCCSDEVAREQATRLSSVSATGRVLERAAIHAIAHHDTDLARTNSDLIQPTLLLWNPVPRAFSGIMTAELTFFRRDILVGPPSGRQPRNGPGVRPFSLSMPDGRILPVQILSVRRDSERLHAPRHYPDQDEVDRVVVAFDAPDVGGLGFAALAPTRHEHLVFPHRIEVSIERLANPFVEVLVASDGAITIVDRRIGEQYHNVVQLEEASDLGDSYTPFVVRDDSASGQLTDVTRRIVANGPLVGALELTFQRAASDGRGVNGRMVLILHADSEMIRIHLEIDNDAIDHRLRLKLPIGTGDSAVAGCAFGHTRREPVLAGGDPFAAEAPVPTAPAQRFVAAGTGSRGLAVLCPGSFEYEWTVARELFVTVLRSIGRLSRAELPVRPGHAGWPMETPEAQEPGRHVMELAVMPVSGAELAEPFRLERCWELVFLAPQASYLRDFVGDVSAIHARSIELDGSGLVFTSMKQAEVSDALILRCYNSESVPVAGRWRFAQRIGRAALVRADESHIADIDIGDGGVVPIDVPARSISTVMIFSGI